MIAKRIAVLTLGFVLSIFLITVMTLDVGHGYRGLTTEALEGILKPRVARTMVEQGNEKQYLFIGDVHGMYDKLMDLLNKVSFESSDMEVIFVGDFITKGPDNVKVVEWMMEHRDKVQFVLGNNEFSVIMCALNPEVLQENSAGTDIYKVKQSHLEVAQSLSGAQVEYIAQEGTIVLEVDLEKTQQRLIAVHAGILPMDYDFSTHHLNLKSTIFSLTNMKYVNSYDNMDTSREKKGNHWQRWYKFWDAEMEAHEEEHVTVIYGHDAKKGLNIRKYTKGLDSAAVKGGKLSALLYTYDSSQNLYKEQLVQV
ncbi:hypothetical protein RNJ44_01651 [Nakaseomyces bracarensis]|uniref:Calcineurin-like phosphoesterase domain-containing protein n=1 Tax=Nakaseomyces bracarensis TaxID=273131 RepID=A0ABR4NNM3_9SACH